MRYIFTIIVFTLLVGYGNVFAQNDTTKIVLKKNMLNGHVFNSINTSKSAFINTYLNTEMSVGNTGTLNLPGIKIGDHEIFAFTGDVSFFSVDITYQQQINDWLALTLAMNLGGRLGTSISTILVDGLNTFGGGSVGWDFRLVKNKEFQMSGSLFVKNIYGSFIDVIGYVNDIIDDVPNPAVVKNIPVLNVGFGGQGAWAINQTYGLQFGADVSFGESFERGEHSIFSSANIAGDMDLMPKKRIPLGFAVGYMLSSNPEDTYLEFIYSNILSGKIAYTGSSDFDLGLQISASNVKVKSALQNTPIIIKSQLDFKFYF